MKKNLKSFSAKALALVLAFSALGTVNADDALAAKKKAKLSNTKLSMTVGQKKTLKIKNSKKKATWSVSSKKIVKLSAKKGTKVKVTALKKGTAKVYAKVSGKKLTCKVKVLAKKSSSSSVNPTQTPGSTQKDTKATATPTAVPTATPTATPYPYPTPNDDPLPTAEPGELLNPALRMKVGTAIDPAKHITPAEGTFADYYVSLSEQNAAILSRDTIVGLRPGQCDVILTSKTDASKVEKFRLSIMGECDPSDVRFFTEKDVPHGDVFEFSYPSDYRENGEDAKAYMYLPPNYDKNKKYNLIFCLHGGGQDYNYWIVEKQPQANFIMDNLLAEGQAEESIVVFPDGDMPYNPSKTYPNIVPNPYLGKAGTMDWASCYLLEFEILNNLIPYMKENYPVYGTPDHMGVCGLSMGCAQTYEIGLKHPDVFHYVGGFSAGPYESPFDYLVTDETIPASELNKQLKLCLFIQGQDDKMADNSERIFVGNCDTKGLNSFFHEVAKTGHDHKCWRVGFYSFAKYAFK